MLEPARHQKLQSRKRRFHVGRSEKKAAISPHQAAGMKQETSWVVQMLDDLDGRYKIETGFIQVQFVCIKVCTYAANSGGGELAGVEVCAYQAPITVIAKPR
jgi:hypothetical protein